MKQPACFMLAIALHFIIVSCTKDIHWKQANFVLVEKESDSVRRKLIGTFQSPSELACSQKCLNHEKCKYKKFHLKTSTCDLLEEELEEVIDIDAVYPKTTTKKEKVLETSCKNIGECKLTSDPECVKTCFKTSNMCDCTGQGVYSSCKSALSTNSFKQAVYWIFHANISHLMAVECMLDKTGESVALFHHDNENATLVDGYEKKGSYKRKFHYDMDMETMIMIINKSSSCKQHTKAKCYDTLIDGYSWLSGRGGRKLNYWGGGPSDGKGCACGITGTCVRSSDKCNCDENDEMLRHDEGFVVKKEDLPITAINAGDTGSKHEQLFYTIGPLMCVF